MWKLIEPYANQGRAPSDEVRVCRYKNSPAMLALPERFVTSNRVDVYVDGSRIGLLQHDKGKYTLFPPNKASKSRNVTLPSAVRDLIPEGGVRPVNVSVEGAMLVIDTAQFRTQRIAAE